MIDITLKCFKKNICKKVHSFHHYLTWFLATISIFAPNWKKFKNKKQKKKRSCYNCGTKGHFAKEYYKKKQD